MKARPIDMNDGNSVVLSFLEWDRAAEVAFRESGGQPMPRLRDPIVIGQFMNWLEHTDDGKEYVRQLAIYHKLMRGKMVW